MGSDLGRQRVESLTLQAGAVAQLGEHRLCKPGVTGSRPVSSTSSRQFRRVHQHSLVDETEMTSVAKATSALLKF